MSNYNNYSIFLLILLRYRLTRTKSIIGESEVKYKVIDLGMKHP